MHIALPAANTRTVGKFSPTDSNSNSSPIASAPKKKEPVVSEPDNITVLSPLKSTIDAQDESSAFLGVSKSFSELLLKLHQSNNPNYHTIANLLLEKLKSTHENTNPTPTQIDETSEHLSNLVSHLDTPESFLSSVQNLKSDFFATLKHCIPKNSIEYPETLEAIIRHGSIINECLQLNPADQDTVMRSLNKINHADTVNEETYPQTLEEFNQRLSKTISDHRQRCNQFEFIGNPVMFGRKLKEAQVKFKSDLDSINKDFNGKILLNDIGHLISNLDDSFKQSNNNADFSNRVKEWTQQLFTQEGAVAASMLLPFISNIMSCTLGQIPVFGSIFQSLASLTSTLSNSAQTIFQAMTFLNQANTSKAVATLAGRENPKSSTGSKSLIA